MNLFEISPLTAITLAALKANRRRRYNKMIAEGQRKLAETTPVSYTRIYA